MRGSTAPSCADLVPVAARQVQGGMVGLLGFAPAIPGSRCHDGPPRPVTNRGTDQMPARSQTDRPAVDQPRHRCPRAGPGARRLLRLSDGDPDGDPHPAAVEQRLGGCRRRAPKRLLRRVAGGPLAGLAANRAAAPRWLQPLRPKRPLARERDPQQPYGLQCAVPPTRG